jgi:hypothetical protein
MLFKSFCSSVTFIIVGRPDAGNSFISFAYVVLAFLFLFLLKFLFFSKRASMRLPLHLLLRPQPSEASSSPQFRLHSAMCSDRSAQSPLDPALRICSLQGWGRHLSVQLWMEYVMWMDQGVATGMSHCLSATSPRLAPQMASQSLLHPGSCLLPVHTHIYLDLLRPLFASSKHGDILLKCDDDQGTCFWTDAGPACLRYFVACLCLHSQYTQINI